MNYVPEGHSFNPGTAYPVNKKARTFGTLNNFEREALNNFEREALNNLEREALNYFEREALNNEQIDIL